MGGWVGDVFGDAVDVVSDAVSDVGGFVKDATNDTIDFIEDTTKYMSDNVFAVLNPVGDFIVKNYNLPSGNLLTLESNIVGGVANNSYNQFDGVRNGDWVQFRDSTASLTSAAIGVIAIIVGALIGWFLSPVVGYPIMAAGFVLLDAQYNNGDTNRKNIALHAEVEKATTKTNYIEKYAVEIQIATTIVASVFASYGVGYGLSYVGISAAVQPYIEEWRSTINIIEAGYGGYETYMAIQAIVNSQSYWEAKLREAEEYFNKLMAQAQSARNQWFDMMTNTDMINRIQAGGDLFNMGAGHDMFSITSVAEPRFALGLIDKSDSEMDRMINNRYYAQSAGSDAFRVQ